MIDVDEPVAPGKGWVDFAKPLGTGAVDHHDAVNGPRALGGAQDFVRIQKCQLVGHGILIVHSHFFAGILQRISQGKLAANAVAIRTHVSSDGHRVAGAQGIQNAVDDLQSAH